MNWFGASWGAPVCDPAEKVETPVGAPCARCNVTIGDDDAGLVLPCIVAPDLVELRAWHFPCLMSDVGIPDARTVLQAALRIARAPSNRLIQCACGVSFLSGAAATDPAGRPMCIGCGVPHERGEG